MMFRIPGLAGPLSAVEQRPFVPERHRWRFGRAETGHIPKSITTPDRLAGRPWISATSVV
jgi:hypothetical protein